MTKKTSYFKNPSVVVSGFVLAGMLGTAIVTLAGYITLPKRVEAVEQKTEKIEDYIKQQQISNDLMQQLITKDKAETVISPDGKSFFNAKKKEWQPIKYLKAYEEER